MSGQERAVPSESASRQSANQAIGNVHSPGLLHFIPRGEIGHKRQFEGSEGIVTPKTGVQTGHKVARPHFRLWNPRL